MTSESLRNAVAAGKQPMFNKVISNIPYSRTQAILVELMQHRWDTAVLAIPGDMAKKLANKRKKLTAVLNYCCDVKIAGNVPAKSFYPSAVDSSILLLKQKNLLDAGFWNFLGEAYNQRNRDAGKVLKNVPAKLANKKVHQLSVEEMKSYLRIEGRKKG